MGEVKNEQEYQLILENEGDWKQYEGLAAGERMASSANDRDKYDQRHAAIQQRWYKQVASELDKKAINNGWKHIYLVGEKVLISEFKQSIKFSSVTTIYKNYTKCTSKEIINQVVAS
jgi:hypothetical protein